MTSPDPDVTSLVDGVLHVRVSAPSAGNPLDAEALLAATATLTDVASGAVSAGGGAAARCRRQLLRRW